MRALVRPTLRSLPWAVSAASIGFALAFVAGTVILRPANSFAAIDVFRRALLFAAAGLPALMDDPAAATIAASPVGLRVRRGLRLATTSIVGACVWAALIALVSTRSTTAVPLWWLLFETMAILAVGVAVGLVAGARTGQGGVSGGASLLILSFAMPLVPARWSLTAGEPGDSVWEAAHARWGMVLIVSSAVIAVMCADPARRRRLRHR